MPMMTPNACHRTGCPNMGLPGRLYCTEHRTPAWKSEEKSLRRGGRRWRVARRWYLGKHPMCEWPECQEPAVEVDHVVALALGGRELREENMQALCHGHHVVKTSADQKKIKSVRVTAGRGV